MIKFKNISDLTTLTLKEKVPQVGSYKVNYVVENNKIIIDREDEWLDFVITNEGNLVIGRGHYKISDKSESLKFAGRLYISGGKICKIDGDSGHYIPTNEEVENIKNFLSTNTGLVNLVE